MVHRFTFALDAVTSALAAGCVTTSPQRSAFERDVALNHEGYRGLAAEALEEAIAFDPVRVALVAVLRGADR